MFNISLTSKDMENFIRYLRLNSDVMLRYAKVAMEKSIFLLEREMKRRAPSSEGKLRQGIKSTILPLRGSVVSTKEYSIYVHEGTRPHWPPYRPNSSLDRWAKKHNIPTYLVARAIARRGTKAQPFIDETIEASKNKVIAYFKKALDSATIEIQRS